MPNQPLAPPPEDRCPADEAGIKYPPVGGRSPASRYLTRAVLAFLIIGPLLAYTLPREIARWYLASAKEEMKIGDENRALELVEKALKWAPRSAEGYAQRLLIRLEQNDLAGALEDGSRMVELTPNNPDGYEARCEVYLRQKNFSKAVNDSRKIVDLLRSGEMNDLRQALNNQAYFVAMGIAAGELDRKLIPSALLDVNAALNINDAYLDTRGYLVFLQGNLEDALRDFDQAIDLAKIRLKHAQRQAPVSEDQRKRLKQCHETLAVVYHHRHLVHKEMGSEKQAADDYDLAVEFGFDPDDEIH